jgi:hypothetical protein
MYNLASFLRLNTCRELDTYLHSVSTGIRQTFQDWEKFKSHTKDRRQVLSEQGVAKEQRFPVWIFSQTFTGEERNEDTRVKILSTVSLISLSELIIRSILSHA